MKSVKKLTGQKNMNHMKIEKAVLTITKYIE